MAQTVKNLPPVQETRVPSLGQEDALEKEMATHSSMLVWEIPWTEEPGGLQSMVSQSDTTEQLSTPVGGGCWGRKRGEIKLNCLEEKYVFGFKKLAVRINH